jgi:hypothetical protein
VFSITLDAANVIETLESMEKQLEEFPTYMAQTLTEWQTEDMHRRYPNIKVTDQYVETDIWPTSRTAMQDTRRARQISRAHATQSKPTFVRVKGPSNRPILRPELYDKLVKRMEECMGKYIEWETD